MPRPRTFSPDDAVRAARDHFWRYGYEATSLTDLERVTGLNRSSIYQAFGTKRQLFDRALSSYLAEVAWPRLAPVEAGGAGPAEIAAYFTALAGALTHAPAGLAARGCLVVNTITELGPHDPQAHAVGSDYKRRITRAFQRALQPSHRAPARKAEVLTGLLIGVLVTARLEPAAAARLARATATEVTASNHAQ
jgi:TetR/AcrR family transcriptional repressor of nem operon